MDDLSKKTALVYDYDANISLARRLRREFGRVLYFCPWKSKYPETLKLAIGSGFDDIKRVKHFSDVIDDVDLFVFPEIGDGDLQLDLVKRGKRVWGSRKAERLEYDRPLFAKTLEKVGLDVAPYKVILGLDEFEQYLRENENKWIKLNMRGDDETWKHVNYELSLPKLRIYRLRYGPILDEIVFTIVDNIDSIVEAAYDGFMVTSEDGKPQFPDIGFLGYEDKSQSHILTSIPYDDFPEQLRNVNERFAPQAARYNFRSAFGTECKITEDGKIFFLDFTARQPSPPGEIIQEMVTNLGDFFYHGAVGEMVPLQIADESDFGVQVNIYSDTSKTNWSTIRFPKELDHFVKLERCCKKNGKMQVLPMGNPSDEKRGAENIGCVVALCCDLKQAIEKVKDYCDQIKGDGLEFKTESLAEAIKRIKEGKKEGIEFTSDKVPEPATVLE